MQIKNRFSKYIYYDDTELWKWYWDVKFYRKKLDPEMKAIYKYFYYRHINEKFINNKGELQYILFKPTNIIL